MEIVAFSRGFDRSRFRCGKPELDDWVKTKAGQQERSNNTRTFLAVEESVVIGYYATTAYRLGLDEAAEMYGVGSVRRIRGGCGSCDRPGRRDVLFAVRVHEVRGSRAASVHAREEPGGDVGRDSRLICTHVVSTVQ